MAKRSLTLPASRALVRRPRHPDLLAILLAGPLLLVAVFALPASLAPMRAAFGLAFVLVAPGYAVAAVLFPRRDDLADAERVALALGLSVALVPLLGLALRFTPWGIAPLPVVAGLVLLTMLAALAALARRTHAGPEEGGVAAATLAADLRLLTAVVAVVATTVASLHLLAPSDRATEFHVQGASGELEAYARTAPAGGTFGVGLGVTNLEGGTETFIVRARTMDETVTVRLPRLAHGQGWRGSVAVPAPATPGATLLSFELYRAADAQPFRSLHLWATVTGPPEERVAGASAP